MVPPHDLCAARAAKSPKTGFWLCFWCQAAKVRQGSPKCPFWCPQGVPRVIAKGPRTLKVSPKGAKMELRRSPTSTHKKKMLEY